MSGQLLSEIGVAYFADFSKMEKAAKDMDKINQNIGNSAQKSAGVMSSSFDRATKSTQSLMQKAEAAGMNVSKLASLQAKAGQSAAQLGVAEARAADALQKANTLANSGAASAEKIAVAQANAAYAAEKVKVAEVAAGTAMQKAASEAGKLSSAMQGGTSKANSFAHAAENAKGHMSGLHANLKSAGGGFLDFASKASMAGMGLVGLLKGAIDLGVGLFKPAMSSEQLGIAFKNLLGSTEKASAMLKELNHFADVTPFEPGPVKQYAAQLIGMGIDAKKTIPIMTSLGDALFAVGHGTEAEMGSVVDIIGKIKTVGKATGEDITQLGEHGIVAGKILAKAFNTTPEGLMKLAEKGLDADKVIDALTKGIEENPIYKGGMAAQATSLGGIMSTLSGYVKNAGNSFLGIEGDMVKAGGLFDIIRQGAGKLAEVISGPAFQNFATGAGKALGDTFKNISDFITPLAPKFNDIATNFSKVTVAFQNPVFAKLATDIGGDLKNGLTWLINALASPQFGEFMQTVGTGIKDAITQLTPVVRDQLLPAIDNLGKTVGPIILDFIKWEQKTGGLKEGMNFLRDTIGIVILVASWLVNAVSFVINAFKFWQEGSVGLGKALGLLFMDIGNWFGGIGAWFTALWTGIATFFTGLWNGIVAGLQAAWAFIVNVIKIGAMLALAVIFAPFIAIAALFIWLYNHNYYFKALVDAIVNFFIGCFTWLQGAWTATVNWLVGAWNAVVGFATDLWGRVSGAIQTGFSAAIGFVSYIWGVISSFFVNAWNNYIANPLHTLWQNVSNVFSSAWGTYVAGPIGSLWTSLSTTVSGWATKALDWGKNLIQSFIDGIKKKAGEIGGALADTASKIANFLGFHSPTKEGPGQEADQWAPNFISMFASGIEAGIPRVESALGNLVKPMAFDLKASSNATGTSTTPVSATPVSASSSQAPVYNYITLQVEPAKVELDHREIGEFAGKYVVKQTRGHGGLR